MNLIDTQTKNFDPSGNFWPFSRDCILQHARGFERAPHMICNKCAHSFIPDISIAPLQVHYYLEVLPTTASIPCQS